jgi:hypothetical protein
MRFQGTHHPLAAYLAALRAAGLVLDRLLEPAPRPLPGDGPGWERWRRVPMFMMFSARRPAA